MQPGTPHTVHSMPSRAPSWAGAERLPESPSRHVRLPHSAGGGVGGPNSPPSMHALSSPFCGAYPPPVTHSHASLRPPSSAPAIMGLPQHAPQSPQPPLHRPDSLRWPPSPGRLSPASSSAAGMVPPPSPADGPPPAAPALYVPAAGPPGAMPPPLMLPQVGRSSGDGSGDPQACGSAEFATADGDMSSSCSCAESVSVAGHSHESSGECSIIVRDPGSLDPSPGAEILPDDIELLQAEPSQAGTQNEDSAVVEAAVAPLPAGPKPAARQLSSSTKTSSIRREASLCMDTGMALHGTLPEHDVPRDALPPLPDADTPEAAAAAAGSPGPGQPQSPEHSTFTAWRSVSAPLQEARTLLLGANAREWEVAAALHELESAPSAGTGGAEFTGLDSPAVASEQLLQPLLLGATVTAAGHRASLDQLPSEVLATSPILSAASPFHYSPRADGVVAAPVVLPPSRLETAAVVLGHLSEQGKHGRQQDLVQIFAAEAQPVPQRSVGGSTAEGEEHTGREEVQAAQDNMCSVGSLIALPDAAAKQMYGSAGRESQGKEYNRAPSFGIDIVRQGSSARSAVPEEEEDVAQQEGSVQGASEDLDVTLGVEELPGSLNADSRAAAVADGGRGVADMTLRIEGSPVRHAMPLPVDPAALATVPSAAGTSLAGTLTFASDGRPSLAPSSPQAHSSASEATLPLCAVRSGAGGALNGSPRDGVRTLARASSAGHEADDEAGSECGSIGSGEFSPLRPLDVPPGRGAGRGLPARLESSHTRARSAFVGTEPSAPWFKRDAQMHKSLTFRGDTDSHSLPQPDLDLGAQSLKPAAAESPPMPLFAGGAGGSGSNSGGTAQAAQSSVLTRDGSTLSRLGQVSTAVMSAEANTRAASSTGFFTWDSSHLSRRTSSESNLSAVSVSSGMPTSPMPDCSSPLDPLTVPDVLMHAVGSVFDSPQQISRSTGAPQDSEPSAFDLTEYEVDSDGEPAADASICLLDLSPPASAATSATRVAGDAAAPVDSPAPPSPPDSPSATLMTLARPGTAPAPVSGTSLPGQVESSGELGDPARACSDPGSHSGELEAPDLGAALISPRRGPTWSAPAPMPPTHSVLGPIPPSPPLPPATSDKGFLLLDDKFPESDSPASPLAAESSCATAVRDPDFRLHPFATATASLATSVTDADSSALWAPADPSDSAPLRQATASTALAASEPSESHARPDSVVSILEPVEPILSRRSSSANPSSPACVGAWGARPPAAPTHPTPAAPLPPPARPALQPIITTAPVATASPGGPMSPSTPLDAHHSGTPTAGGTLPWARYFLDAPPSRISSLQSSPAFSHRAMSTHRSPSGLPVTPTGSTSSVRHAAVFSPAANMSPSVRAAVQAVAAGGGSASNEPPDYDPADPPMVLWLPVYHRARRTGLEAQKEFPIAIGDVIAQRYRVTRPLGSAAFSRAVAAIDVHSGEHVCLKVIRSNKDFFDQSLDEVRIPPTPPRMAHTCPNTILDSTAGSSLALDDCAVAGRHRH